MYIREVFSGPQDLCRFQISPASSSSLLLSQSLSCNLQSCFRRITQSREHWQAILVFANISSPLLPEHLKEQTFQLLLQVVKPCDSPDQWSRWKEPAYLTNSADSFSFFILLKWLSRGFLLLSQDKASVSWTPKQLCGADLPANDVGLVVLVRN